MAGSRTSRSSWWCTGWPMGCRTMLSPGCLTSPSQQCVTLCIACAMPSWPRRKLSTCLQWHSVLKLAVASSSFPATQPSATVLGTIDGCQVRIKPPLEAPQDYLNRKLFHSGTAECSQVAVTHRLVTSSWGWQLPLSDCTSPTHHPIP